MVRHCCGQMEVKVVDSSRSTYLIQLLNEVSNRWASIYLVRLGRRMLHITKTIYFGGFLSQGQKLIGLLPYCCFI